MRLLHDLILIKPTVAEQVKNGLIIPKSANDQKKGEIILIGSKVKKLKVGQTVVYHDLYATAINYDNQPMLLLKESRDVVGIL